MCVQNENKLDHGSRRRSATAASDRSIDRHMSITEGHAHCRSAASRASSAYEPYTHAQRPRTGRALVRLRRHSNLAGDPGRSPSAALSPLLHVPNDSEQLEFRTPGRQLAAFMHAHPDREVGFPEADRCTIALTVPALSACPRIIAHA